MIIRTCKFNQSIMFGIYISHFVFLFCPAGVHDFNTMDISGKKPNMVNI